jgi:hypothetical protein
MTIDKISEKLAIREFITLVKPKLKDLITRLRKEAKEDWKPLSKR